MAEKKSFMEKLKGEFTTRTLVMIPICVAVNVIGGMLCSYLKLPLYLDSIGTIEMGFMIGPWSAALTGTITNVFLTITASPTYLPYALVSIFMGLVAGYCARTKWFKKKWSFIPISVIIVLGNTVLNVVISYVFFGGAAVGSTGTSVVQAAFIAAAQDILVGLFSSSILTELADKVISILIAFLVWSKIPQRYLVNGVDTEEQVEEGEILDEVPADKKEE